MGLRGRPWWYGDGSTPGRNTFARTALYPKLELNLHKWTKFRFAKNSTKLFVFVHCMNTTSTRLLI